MEKILIVHHNDLDGRCSAAIVNYVFRNWSVKPVFHEIDYDNNFPFELLDSETKLYILDFSVKEETMKEILKAIPKRSIIWIDHHKTAMSYSYNTEEIRGIRDPDEAACVLAWKFFIGSPTPLAVTLIGDRDAWHWKFGDQTKYFNAGMLSIHHNPWDEIWKTLFEHDDECESIIDRGKVVADYLESWNGELRKTGFAGRYRNFSYFIINSKVQGGSDVFGDKLDEYDFGILYYCSGKKYIYNLYSKKIDVSEIAKTFGGGGHKGAAGFVTVYRAF